MSKLATINQVFSLLDPLIFRHVIDQYATRFQEYTTGEFFRGVSLLLGAAVGVAFVSRVAKNFQDYYINVITQRLGAQRSTSDGIRHSLELPYSVFEDQRSGETLGRLQKVRTDVEKLIATSINVLFTSLVGIVFVMIYAFSVHWLIAPVYFLTVPLLGVAQLGPEQADQDHPEGHRRGDDRAGRIDDRVAAEHRAREEPRARRSRRSPGSTRRRRRSCKLELKKVRYLRSLSFIQGTAVNLLRTSIMFLMLYLILHARQITVGQFFSLFIYSFFIFGPLQELGNIINIYRETEASLNVYEDILRIPKEPRRRTRCRCGICGRSRSSTSRFSTSRRRRRRSATSRSRSSGARRSRSSGHRAPARPRWSSCWSGCIGRAWGRILYNGIPGHRDRPRRAARAHRVRHPGHAALLGHDPREPAVRESRRDRRRVPRRAAQGGVRQPAGAGRQGLDTVIGEGGVKVSGGEKQRLSIARALLRQPHLLVFDEATSSLDSLTEEGIVDTIRDVATGGDAITVLIAHRLSTILHADRIYVLERGRIVETGRHDELVEQKGLYYAMWRQQIGERRSI